MMASTDAPWFRRSAEEELEDAFIEAMDRVLSRFPSDQRDQALEVISEQVEACLADAPVTGRSMDALRTRARLAVLMASLKTTLQSGNDSPRQD